jgi:vacuolar-type H+-ATPase subunit E/Vma4
VALADLLSALERDTQAEVRAILAAGAADAARIDEESTAARAEQIARAAAPAIADLRAADEARLAEITHRARADVLAARAAMLERIRAATRAELAGLVDTRLGDGLITAALACAGAEPGVLRCAPALASAARAAAPATLRVEVDAAVATGVVVELASGTQIAATLDAFLEREWPRLACEALALERER